MPLKCIVDKSVRRRYYKIIDTDTGHEVCPDGPLVVDLCSENPPEGGVEYIAAYEGDMLVRVFRYKSKLRIATAKFANAFQAFWTDVRSIGHVALEDMGGEVPELEDGEILYLTVNPAIDYSAYCGMWVHFSGDDTLTRWESPNDRERRLRICADQVTRAGLIAKFRRTFTRDVKSGQCSMPGGAYARYFYRYASAARSRSPNAVLGKCGAKYLMAILDDFLNNQL